MDNQKISIIISIYNEAKNVEEFVKRIQGALSSPKRPYELIFIDDNSTDETDEIFKKIEKDNKIIFKKKQGKKGKAFSLIEGFRAATGEIIAMIDGDLQYPPEAIPYMVEVLEKADIVVANRKNYKDTIIRKILSGTFRTVFGKLLFGLSHDIQSGLKVFKKEVIDTIKFTPGSAWTFDLEFLHRAKQAGFSIQNFDIVFSRRKNGESKVIFLKTTLEIGVNALKLRTKTIHPAIISPKKKGSMLGAGLGYKKKRYITHTVMEHKNTAIRTLTLTQKIIVGFILIDAILGFIINPLITLQLIVAFLSLIYFLDVLFNLYLVLKSLRFPQEINIEEKDITKIDEVKLPVYTILCPLYHEAHVLPQFLSSIEKISWPKDKLDVILLLEEDDAQTIEAAHKVGLPSYVRSLIVPHSIPKTKPKACNFGLAHANGEYLVIYDAEDIPDPMQLKKAYLGFQRLDESVICLQAKLNYYNPHQNLLTRFFTAEYSLWFDVTLTGLQSINTSIPLGGTSNHFKIESLKKVLGWDPFNVTEDADLGVRLFKKGFKTAMIDSTTLEEANSRLGNWFRQRSRWIKGYMQTYLVHTRENPSEKKQGIHSLIFQLIIGGKIAFVLINPLLWFATFAYFALYMYVGSAIEALYPSVVFYMAVFSLVFGNFLFLYYYMIGVAKKGHWSLMKYVLLVPVYWLMISIAAIIALYQLIFKPHFWEKTVHGFHLNAEKSKVIAETADKTEGKLNILIFNWRDTKHQWAGGAEVYIHELAKRWVKDGNNVTLFCGNSSGKSKSEIIGGVQIYRRGGFYTVYFWAIIYYIFKFQGKYDVIIDCENGIPFFTPLYCRKPKFLLIHHVHQEVFRKSLRWPFSRIALFLEARLMPVVYRDIQVITVSPSSREEILRHKLTKTDPIVIYNGVDLTRFKPGEKNKNPMVLYLGRLQYYKSLHILIEAAKFVLDKIPKVEFVIAGEGVEKEKLIQYARKLEILEKIKFLGKVTEEEKIRLFQNAWVFVNPSFMEGWGITTIEANACGTPAVASNVPGLRDSIKNPHSGILVEYGDCEAFAQNIINLVDDERLRKELSEEAIKWSKQFTWEKSATEFYSIVINKVGLKQETTTEKAFVKLGN